MQLKAEDFETGGSKIPEQKRKLGNGFDLAHINDVSLSELSQSEEV